MVTVRPAAERGATKIDWLDSKHTFSFADYYDPAHMAFGALRVINDDRVAPGMGFGTHPHRDMEIVSYVVEGELAHKDSLGTGSTIRRGDVQRMTAGTGVRHSEFNASKTKPVHFLQVWIVPLVAGLLPEYEQKTFSDAERSGRLRLVASQDGREGSVTVHQDLSLYSALLGPGEQARLELAAGRSAWVQVVKGRARANGQPIKEGDGAAITQESALELVGEEAAELLVFELVA